MTQVWILGRLARCSRDRKPLEAGEQPWQLRGVYRDYAAAANECHDCCDVVFPYPVGSILPITRTPPVGMQTPCCKQRDLTA